MNEQDLHPERAEPSSSKVLYDVADVCSQPPSEPGREPYVLVDKPPNVGQLSNNWVHLVQKTASTKVCGVEL